MLFRSAEISEHMVKRISGMLQNLTWDKQHVADFLGIYLTEPKPDVVFEKNRKISKNEFSKQLATKTLLLNLKSQLLFTHEKFYLNGEKLAVPVKTNEVIKQLADKKYLKITALKANIHAACSDTLYEAYLAGYVCFKHE